jgi:hypothetical protein
MLEKQGDAIRVELWPVEVTHAIVSSSSANYDRMLVPSEQSFRLSILISPIDFRDWGSPGLIPDTYDTSIGLVTGAYCDAADPRLQAALSRLLADVFVPLAEFRDRHVARFAGSVSGDETKTHVQPSLSTAPGKD